MGADIINTTKVTGRRQLHFGSLDDLAADVERLAACRRLRTLGNWSAGQIFEHLALTMNKSIDGFGWKMPAVVRVLIRFFFKRRTLTRPMTAGFRLPGRAAEMLPPPVDTAHGLDSLRRAIRRAQAEDKRSVHPVFGPMTRAEWDQLHCRHAELHLSFLVPAE
jgi:hypothetical protein